MENTKQVFLPQGSLDHPFDVTLVVGDRREFKAHRTVLSEASPFFEKLLNSEMREANEGVIRLEMVKESYMRDILKFIYTGSLDISDEDNAKELIAIADYLVLQRLKTQAERVLEKNLNTLNAISTFYYGQTYQCTELISVARKFILANFTTVAKTEEFCALSSKEVIMWISNDELNVNAEEDVFKIILTWINHAKSERKKYFSELFRQVRLVYVSRDYLVSDVVTNELVNENEDCLDLVKDATNCIDSRGYRHLSVKPRKSLETPVLIVAEKHSGREGQILCYHPREEKWSTFPGKLPPESTHIIACSGKLYFISKTGDRQFLVCYDSFSNHWTWLPYEENRQLLNVFVRNEKEIYTVSGDNLVICPECCVARRYYRPDCGNIHHLAFLAKYDPQQNSWEEISSFNLAARIMLCVVARDNFIYFLGGFDQEVRMELVRADRYDLGTSTWCRIADLKVPRHNTYGAAAYGKIFVTGETKIPQFRRSIEVYDETTDEWQLTANMQASMRGYLPFVWLLGMVCAEGKLYVMNRVRSGRHHYREIEYYDPDNDEWRSRIEEHPYTVVLGEEHFLCSTMVFKGSEFLKHATIREFSSSIPLGAEGQSKSSGKQRCVAM